MSGPPEREDGVVLLLVLVLIVVSISTVYAMAKTTTVELLSAKQREHRTRAQLLAVSGLDLALRTLVDDVQSPDELHRSIDSRQDAWALLGEEPLEPDPGAELHIQVEDAGSRISINALVDPATGERIGEQSRAFLVAALESIVEHTPELSRSRIANDEARGELADAILDWIDRDEDTRIGIPEEMFYEKAEGKPLNRPVFSLDELATVPEMEPLLLDALPSYFSPYPLFPTFEQGGVNPNTAPPQVLSLLYTGTEFEMRLISEDDVFRLMRIRERGLLFCPQRSEDNCVDFAQELRIGAGQQVFPPLTYGGSVFHIKSEAKYPNARACLNTVIDRSRGGGAATLYYAVGC